jgi:CRISPR/Cas system-associated exonuclease Cas4 (RecB family)
MQSFLSKVVEKILQAHEQELNEVMLIVPTKRAATFFYKELANQHQAAMLAPKVMSLADFIEAQSELIVVEQIDLLMELYQLHCQLAKEEVDAFHEFLSWGTTLLQDFNEIDRYLVDGEELFTFLNEAKAIEVWNLDRHALSDFQKEYLSFWRSLATYYKEFNKRLKEKGKAYSGMLARYLAEGSSLNKITQDPKKIYVVGFNALSESEKLILEKVEGHYVLEYLWDTDSYYMNDPMQEAGMFLRKEKANRKNFNWVFDDFSTQAKVLNLYGASGNVGQAKTLAWLLDQGIEEASKTAVVLADESQLSPVLESLPESLKTINVTMGSGLKNFYGFDFFAHYLNALDPKYLQLDQSEQQNLAVYYEPLVKFLEHPLCLLLSKQTFKSLKALQEQIKKESLIWIPHSTLAAINKEIGFELFVPPSDKLIQTIILSLHHLVDELMSMAFEQKNAIDLEYLAHFKQQFNKLKEIQTEHGLLKSFKDLHFLYEQSIAEAEVSFVGEPLSGLQLMGVLESRLLDFERIIFCGLNEGTLPAGKKQNSFIPFDVKRKYGLPSYQEKDSIYAYHFYRALQRVKRADLIYNTQIGQLGSGEKSRFLSQLEEEANQKNSKIEVNKIAVDTKLGKTTELSQAVKNNEQAINKVFQLAEKGLSASALNTYLSCPLDFYYRYVLGLREEDELSNEIEANVLGTILHDSLENLYRPLLGKPLNSSDLKKIAEEAKVELSRQFGKTFGFSAVRGKHKLAFEASSTYLKNLIKIDQKLVKSGKELIVSEVEKSFIATYALKLPELDQLNLRGKIDRIDFLNGEKRLIDYKSGKTTHTDLSARNLETILNGGKVKVVQLLFYLAALNELDSTTKAGIISMKNSSQAFMGLREKNQKEVFDELIHIVVAQLLDQNTIFEHNLKANYCSFCQ